MRRRSNSRRCLICLGAGGRDDLEECFPGNAELVMAGAVNCHQLERQLEKMFILRRILEVPESLCEEMLRENCGGEGDDSGNPEGWFNVCGQCMERSVAQAWRIYQQILGLDVKMLEIKNGVRETMKTEMGRERNRGYVSRQLQEGDGGMEGKIRRFLFPDFKVPKVEEDEVEDVDDYGEDVEIEVDSISNYFESDDEDDWSDEVMTPKSDPLWNDEEEPSKLHSSTFPPKRRGRPPKDPSLRRHKSSKSGGRPGRPRKNQDDRIKKKRRKSFRFLQFDEDPVKPKKWNWHCCHEPECRAKYTSLEELLSHQQLHDERRGKEKGPLDCPQCPFPAGDPAELELHIQNRHRKESKSLNYFCPKCDFRLENDFAGFKEHFDTEHPSLPEEMRDDELDEPDLKSSELPVTCPFCQRRCENLRYYSVHLRKMHPEHVGIQVETLECDLCGLKFATQLALKTHINSEHKRPSKYVCDECGQGYQFLSRLEAHKVKHVNKTKRDYVCHLCGLDYAYKYVLEHHYRKCHPNAKPGGGEEQKASTSGEMGGGGQDYTCKFCEFTSPLKGIMIRHLQQHKQEIGHKCDQCGKCYVNEAGLKRHLKINHPLVKEDIPCPYCGKAFVSTEYMRDHVTKYCKIKKMGGEPTSSGRQTVERIAVKPDIIISSILGGDGRFLTNLPQDIPLNDGQNERDNIADYLEGRGSNSEVAEDPLKMELG